MCEGGAPKTTPRSGDFPGGLAAVIIELYSQLRLLIVKRCLVQSAGGKAHGVNEVQGNQTQAPQGLLLVVILGRPLNSTSSELGRICTMLSTRNFH